MDYFIDLQGIQKSFGEDIILKQIDMKIAKGQLFGLLGPSGSGKTTIVKMMIGLLIPTEGTIFVDGKIMPDMQVMPYIGYMAQADALYKDLTGKQNLDFFASMYGMHKKERQKRIEIVANIVDLTDHLDKRLEVYSGGMLRRMSLAVALVHKPKLLILDEPTVGIDPVLRASIWRNFKEIQKAGTTIIITTHVMDEAEKCDNLALLRDGRIIAAGSPSELKIQSNKDNLEDAFLYFGQEEATII